MSKGLEILEKAKARTGFPLNEKFAPITFNECEIIKNDLLESDYIKKIMGTPIQELIKCLEQADNYKDTLKSVNAIMADYYNGEIDADACLCAINEILKNVDWSDKYENNKTH